MAKPFGFENVVSRSLDEIEGGEFQQLLARFSARSVPTGRGLAMAHAPVEMERDSDEEIRLQSDNPRGVRIEDVPAPVAEDVEKFVSVLATGDFRPLQFVTGAEALKDGPPARREKLPTAKVFKIRGRRWEEVLRYCD